MSLGITYVNRTIYTLACGGCPVLFLPYANRPNCTTEPRQAKKAHDGDIVRCLGVAMNADYLRDVAVKRFATSSQFTTFHMAFRYSARRF